jgi:nitroimidazol reductase NimA-like FMN-containing flavoprotein (pyridoxamine 5'-phosphate oxidase superfamily)
MADGGADTRLDPISREECIDLLGVHEIGRVAFFAAGSPQIRPVNYAIDGDEVVFRVDEGSMLRWISGGAVAFEVDGYDVSERTGWSVLVQGQAEEVSIYESRAMRARLSELALYPWAPGEKQHWVRVTMPAVTGRRIMRG